MTKPIRQSPIPQDRLTRIADGMLAAFHQHDEKRGTDRVIVFLNDEQQGGIGIAGYDDPDDAIVDLVRHLTAMFRARGQELHFVPIGTGPATERS